MSGTNSVEHEGSAASRTEEARRGVEQAEAGSASGATQVERARAADPVGVEAVEQETSDGSEGRGLSR